MSPHRSVARLAALTTLVALAACSTDAPPITGPDAAPADGAASAASSAGRVTHRPIEEFVAAQPNYCLLPGNPNGCLNLFPGLDIVSFPDFETGLEFAIDYPGIATEYLRENGGPDLGTTFSGHVKERVLNDGRAEITVLLRTENALGFVADLYAPFPPLTLLLGALPTEVLDGMPVALGSSTLRMTYIAPEPGMPLVAVSQVLYFETHIYELVRLSFHAELEGELRRESGYPAGTIGRVIAHNVERHNPGRTKLEDPYVVEIVKLFPKLP